MLQRLTTEEDGQTLIEYGLLLVLVALLVISFLTVLGGKVRDLYVHANTQLKSTM